MPCAYAEADWHANFAQSSMNPTRYQACSDNPLLREHVNLRNTEEWQPFSLYFPFNLGFCVWVRLHWSILLALSWYGIPVLLLMLLLFHQHFLMSENLHPQLM
jgi:hypothetical protein